MSKIKVNKYNINITNQDKILFPKSKITKKDIINYYLKIGPMMLKYTKNHALTMLRFPNGIDKEGFYQKDTPDFFPEWIKTFSVEKEKGGIVKYVVANNIATIVYLANFGCLTPHLWLSKIDKINYPDKLIFDFDPPDEKHFRVICQKVQEAGIILKNYGLIPFIMTTGSRGLHLVVPLKRKYTFDQIRTFARNIGNIMIKNDPKNLTMEIHKNKRGKKIFIDVLRNGYSATAVSPYAVRAKEHAPIATPIYWEEIKDPKLNPQKYDIKNIFDKLKIDGDPWSNFNKYAKLLKF